VSGRHAYPALIGSGAALRRRQRAEVLVPEPCKAIGLDKRRATSVRYAADCLKKNGTLYAWVVSFVDGSVSGDSKLRNNYVRAVRTGL
jgi:hypothetical protein